jgi:hypothetical protein
MARAGARDYTSCHALPASSNERSGMFRTHSKRNLVLAGLVAAAVAVPVSALAATKPATTRARAADKPVITKLSVTKAKPMEKFAVDGKHFTHVLWVKVDRLRAGHKVDSATKITVTVPRHAKTGRVEVMTRAGTAWSPHLLKTT